jgi:hypothetical protein
MPADDERRPGKPGPDGGTPPAAGTGARDTREARDARETRDVRDGRLPLGELLRRGLSAGQAVSESLFPRELASNLASQLVDARHGLVNAIAVEVGRFLRQADIASEMRKVLAGLNVEATIQLRFSEDQQGNIRSDVEVQRGGAVPRTKTPTKPPPGRPEG